MTVPSILQAEFITVQTQENGRVQADKTAVIMWPRPLLFAVSGVQSSDEFVLWQPALPATR